MLVHVCVHVCVCFWLCISECACARLRVYVREGVYRKSRSSKKGHFHFGRMFVILKGKWKKWKWWKEREKSVLKWTKNSKSGKKLERAASISEIFFSKIWLFPFPLPFLKSIDSCRQKSGYGQNALFCKWIISFILEHFNTRQLINRIMFAFKGLSLFYVLNDCFGPLTIKLIRSVPSKCTQITTSLMLEGQIDWMVAFNSKRGFRRIRKKFKRATERFWE